MKFPTIIFNFLIIKLLGDETPKFQLRGMYEYEKTLYLNTTVNKLFNEIYNIVIHDDKQNMNTTYFDLYYIYFLNEQRILSDLEAMQTSYLTYFNNKNHNIQQSIYQECVTFQNNVNHIPNDQYFMIYQLPYNIPIEMYISRTLEKLSTSLPECFINKIINSPSCYNIYSISW
jgi:hypothetical protein